jgi:hypothetical protein
MYGSFVFVITFRKIVPKLSCAKIHVFKKKNNTVKLNIDKVTVILVTQITAFCEPPLLARKYIEIPGLAARADFLLWWFVWGNTYPYEI